MFQKNGKRQLTIQTDRHEDGVRQIQKGTDKQMDKQLNRHNIKGVSSKSIDFQNIHKDI